LRTAISLALCALLFTSAQAWWGTGHMLVARIAYDKLQKENPSLVTRANSVLSYLSSFTTLEKSYPFVECATFADEIKSKGWDDQSDWHFVDNPFMDDGYSTYVAPNLFNVTWELGELISALKNAKSEAPALEQSNSGAVSWNLGDSFNIRLLIHYVGDIHQPLHATSRFTSKYPNGDRGGNSFPLTSVDNIDELHALWDSVLHVYSNDLSLPLSSSDWSYLGTQSSTLTAKYPTSFFPDLKNDYKSWDDESFEISQHYVYTGITENTVPSDAYLEQGVAIAEQQIVKAGYRLANLFETMWGTSEEAPSTKGFVEKMMSVQ